MLYLVWFCKQADCSLGVHWVVEVTEEAVAAVAVAVAAVVVEADE